MTITLKESRRLRRLIKELCEAERADEMSGTYSIEDAESLEEELRIARKRVDECIKTLRLDDFRSKS